MYSRDHALLSGVLAILLLVTSSSPVDPALLVAYVVLLGVGIDIDHFLIARLRTGGWRNLRAILRTPRIAVLDQEAIFAPGDVRSVDRLLSHSLELGLGVGVLWFTNRHYLAWVTAVTIGLHIAADIYSDVTDLPDPAAT